MSNNRSSNRSNNNTVQRDPGIYTCPTCNALFTCLKFYQQHVTQHADSNRVKLYCCNICRFSTEVQFQYNWHLMSHKNAPPHSCSVCQDRPSTDNNHLNGNDNVSTGRSTRKSQQNGNSNKKVKYNNNKAFVKQEQEEDDEEDDSDDSNDSDEESDEEVDEEEAEGEEDEDESEADDEDEESEEADDEEVSQSVNQHQIQLQQNASNNQLSNQRTAQHQEQEDISDEEDDEEEEIESEVDSENDDDDVNNELPEEYLVAQRLNTETNNSAVYQYNDMQNTASSVQNNLLDVNQGPPYTKSTVSDISNDILSNDGIVSTKGRGKGKGNRKSRTINQMGGQVDDETSQLRRKFHCSHCGKSFKTKSHLQRHILTHTGEKPYHCNRCGAKFNQSSSLRNHIIALHTKEYPHFCNHCQKGFLMPALLTKHLQTSHRDQPDCS